jgi:hypothetical protein
MEIWDLDRTCHYFKATSRLAEDYAGDETAQLLLVAAANKLVCTFYYKRVHLAAISSNPYHFWWLKRGCGVGGVVVVRVFFCGEGRWSVEQQDKIIMDDLLRIDWPFEFACEDRRQPV